MKKVISILTATRAEYGLLKPVIEKLNQIDEFDVKVVVTGAHLSPEFGLTYKEIENDNIKIDEKIEILLSSDTPSAISKSMGLAMISFADYFARVKSDLLIVLGDRYETLAVCLSAMNQNIPIAHLYGGETTEGAVDEAIRHSITKLSHLHFTSTDEYRKRVIQLGENPKTVFNVGSLGVENALQQNLLSKEELASWLKLDLNKPYIIGTYHPVTLENSTAHEQTKALLDCCISKKDINFIFTKSNADSSGRIINKLLDEYSQKYENIFVFTSLGMLRYLSSLKYAKAVIGNSSSGIVEAPSFHIPTINIGDRQKGRIQSKSTINCEPTQNAIEFALIRALSDDMQNLAKNSTNPYQKANTSDNIVKTIKEFILEGKLTIKKKFYDMECII